jgi:hypothetical protein
MLGRARIASRGSVMEEALVAGEISGVEVLVEGNIHDGYRETEI